MKRVYMIAIIIIMIFGSIKSQNFYDINTINIIEITFEESNWDYLLDQFMAAGNEERLMGAVTINGQEFDSVGVRYKGNSSYNANQIKNPLNVKLDYIIDGQEIEGFGTLKLANVYKDPSFVREVLSYEIARKYFPASQSNYANVYINGIHLGLYTSDQDVDKFFMRTHFNSDENARLKGELGDNLPPGSMGGVWEYFGNDSTDYYEKYALESDFGWEKLIWFLDTLNNATDDVEEVLNIDRHLWFLAFQNLLVNLDGPINNPQNYYIYKDDNRRFNPIPWDLNESFGVFTMLQSFGPLNTTQLQQLSPFVNINESDYPIINKILTNSIYRKMYVAHMKTISEENFENGLYETRALEIQDIIDGDVLADNNKFYSYSDFINNINNSIGGGPFSIIGITQLMDTRVTYINSLTDFQYTAPEISNVSYSPEEVLPNTVVWINAEVTGGSDISLAYRTSQNDIFTKIEMFDDGNHEDGAANDDVFGIDLTAGLTDIQFYIYAENQNAASFFPARAEYEFLNIDITGSVVINEFLASNENTVPDQDGEYDDWIELYNNGDEDLDLSGFYLTDKADDLGQWVFPDTVISAGDYLIVWADNDTEQEGLHANFKLSSSGETLILSLNDFSIIDEISFTQQTQDISFGRYPNGTGEFIEMMPTFSAENTNQTIGLKEETVTETGFILKQNRPNPADDITSIDFSLNEGGFVSLNVHNSYGSVIQNVHSGYLPEGEYSYSLQVSDLSKGLYFYSLTVDDQVQYKKMIIQ